LTPKQLEELREIARGYANFECIDCALAMRKYLVEGGIDGNLIKISNSNYRTFKKQLRIYVTTN
jgi:hypothetical protein